LSVFEARSGLGLGCRLASGFAVLSTATAASSL
jgi:hypothetical protein